jgi:hypothetical protein
MEAHSSSETSVLTRATRRHIPEDAIVHSHRRENLKSNIHVVVNSAFSPAELLDAHPTKPPPRFGRGYDSVVLEGVVGHIKRLQFPFLYLIYVYVTR